MRRTDDVASSSFGERLLRFLEREEAGERRSTTELRALPVEQRVLEGECVRNAVFLGVRGDVRVFRVAEDLSKFRSGDAVLVGDGIDFAAAVPLVYGRLDPERQELHLEADPYARTETAFEVGAAYVVDRRPLDLRGRLRDVVRAGFADARIASVLEGRHVPSEDAARGLRARRALAERGLASAQVEAGAAAIATESLALVQGPPGTGKTRLLAEILAVLGGAGCRIALCACTHRAVDHALLALRRVAPSLGVAKIGNPGSAASDLRRAGVRLAGNPRRADLGNVSVVAGTPFALARLPQGPSFHYTVFDEAGQLPIPHAIAGMLLAKRWLFFGDHAQLPPVVRADHADLEIVQSVFERLHARYGSWLLDTTWRMNDGLCAVVSDAFYGGRLQPASDVRGRRMPFRPGGEHDAVLDPELPVVIAVVDHEHPGMRSVEEAEVAAGLVAEIVQRHGVPPCEVAVIAPFRAQVRQVRAALQRRGLQDDALVVDTVERIQGQEREVVVLTLATGDPASLDARAGFFFSTNRLNVALSRARTKAIVVAAPGPFRALPEDPIALRAASCFKELWTRLPRFDCMPSALGSRT